MIKFLSLILFFFCQIFLAKSQTCNNWLYNPVNPSFVEAGQVNISGNKITVEATINRTTTYSGGQIFGGDIVSKHNTPADANYLLRPNNAEITTTNGYFRTPDICDIQLNKTYHVAMVYDGSTLKFYRNGFLMSQVAASGTLFQNTWKTTIGYYEPRTFNTNFIGYINEVRIWNVAKTQAELKTYMNASLPNPTTQAGLVAYYTFDNLVNKQGNAAFNGTLGGSAAINQANTNCTFTPDSCNIVVTPGIGGIINDYTPVLAFNPCTNLVTVADAGAFKTGDTVLMIQMQGAIIDSNNTAAFGGVTDYKNAGNYTFNFVKGKSGNIIELKNTITRGFDVPNGKVQLIRVPYFNTANITSTLTCLPWDGAKGGVLVFNARDNVQLNANIDVSGKGFRGGNSANTGSQVLSCMQNNYFYPAPSTIAAAKGEGIALISTGKSYGKGALANGGGGGLGHNSGGGGGSNATSGGFGGYQLEACGNAPFDNRGIGGKPLLYSNAQNKIFMGGGGGSGHVDNIGGSAMQGGNGGGIVIIQTTNMSSAGYAILSKGGDAPQCTSPAFANCHDAGGGGGGGGAILINAATYANTLQLNVAGGKGGDISIFNIAAGAGRIGPGGGGGAGVTWLNAPSKPANVTPAINGGLNGVIPGDNNNPWGATAGQTGSNLFSLAVHTSNLPFKKNVDSVRIKDSLSSCSGYHFSGTAYTSFTPVTSWQWYFGDATTANTQNTAHVYTNTGNYTVKLIVTDINGCKDSISKMVTVAAGLGIDFNYQRTVCTPFEVAFNGIGIVGHTSVWHFGDGTTVSGQANATHSYAGPGNYLVKYIVTNGTCQDSIIKTISVNVTTNNIVNTNDTTICFGSSKQLLTRPALSFCWTPATYLDNPNSPNPTTNTTQNITYYYTAEVTGINLLTNGNFNSGNTGFTSNYNFANPNTTEAQFFIGPSPAAWNPGLSNCGDHTTGNGNMLLVNGAPTPDAIVWTQQVAVTPNTNYAFSTWVQALWPPNPAQLRFSINGNDVGTPITASLPTCNWSQFYTTWNSGSNTTATISIVNKNTAVQGNDFALDDISFAPVFLERDSVKITVDSLVVKTNNDISGCAGTSFQLNTSGAISYNWSPGTGLNNSAIANPVALPTATTRYIVTGTNGNGCTSKDTVTISLLPTPVISKTPDSSICKNGSLQLSATGGGAYSWLPVGSLANANTANPVATPLVATVYYVTVTGVNSCTSSDSLKISIRPDPAFTLTPSRNTCQNTFVALAATGGSTYSWTPAVTLNQPTSANTMASPLSTTTYSVSIFEAVCNIDTTLSTTITVLPAPVITTNKSNDIDCSNNNSRLTAAGADQYIWTPALSLSNPLIGNPVASPGVTTKYLVQGTDLMGCSGFDSVIVNVSQANKNGYLMPTAFSPNNDGLNDCYGMKNWGAILELDFSIYNRFGARVFYTNQPGQCWNGKYKGIDQDPAVFIYIIKAKTSCDNAVFKKGAFSLVR